MNKYREFKVPDFSKIFLIQSIVFLTAMVLLSLFLAWLFGINPFLRMHFNAVDIAVGIGAAAVMLAIFYNVKGPREQAQKVLGGVLTELSWGTLLFLALFVGFAEELLFRGVLEPWVARWDPIWALILVNILFGVLHSLSVQYAIVAGILGGLMSLLAYGPGGDNLLRAMVTHGVYDFLGFLWIAHAARKELKESVETAQANAVEADDFSLDSTDDVFIDEVTPPSPHG